MNTQELHAAAAARLEKIESKLEELFEARNSNENNNWNPLYYRPCCPGLLGHNQPGSQKSY